MFDCRLVDDEGTVLGRSPDTSGRINDPQISRAHARIDWRDGQFMLTDLASANGTFLNSEPIAEPVALNTGDVISIGDSRIVVNVG